MDLLRERQRRRRRTRELFGTFQRLHTRDEFEGTGISLADVHRIIVPYGGRVWVKARPGAAAVFSFTLPIVA